MVSRDTARQQAMAFLAAYDGLPGDDEQHVASLARRWLGILRSRQSVQGLVEDMIDELYDAAASGGCGWEDLRRAFTAWAAGEDLLDPGDRRLDAVRKKMPKTAEK